MDFTREPIIETIITPKEGYKLVIRSSKNAGQEEYFVDAVEIVAFGHALFFRSLERPKAFLVPVSDYETVEVREARIVLKNAGLDRSIKIGGGREGNLKIAREIEKEEIIPEEEPVETSQEVEAPAPLETRPEVRVDKKRDRRRHYRKRRGRDEREEEGKEENSEPSTLSLEEGKGVIPALEQRTDNSQEGNIPLSSTSFSALLQPPPTLISETINRYRQNELFKGAFYLTEEEQYRPHDKVQELLNEDDEDISLSLQEPTFEPEEEQPSLFKNDEENVVEERKKEEIGLNEGQEGELNPTIEEEKEAVIEKQEENSSFIFESEEDKGESNSHPLSDREEEPLHLYTQSPYSSEEEPIIEENPPHLP